MMKLLLSSLAVLATLCHPVRTHAQQKGAAPITNHQSPVPATTRAVVVGISDYQDKDIPDLRFADRDAEAFANWLQSPAGGALPAANIKLLTNQHATMAAVAAELDWPVETSQPGDRALIYFSGHGDVEAKTARQPGFLLTYDSPPKIYIAGAYPLFYLQLIVETLSNEKNVQALVITDACRAGKLAGSDIGGAQATAANLAKQYANEIKILSCQPNEFSLEGEQWGGGRGAFSYHLIEGLTGLADRDGDALVKLLEIENYLEDIVPRETAPQSQIPLVVGSKGLPVAAVDAALLADLKQRKAKQLPSLAGIESKGFEESLLANADSSIQQLYDAFLAALEKGNLLEPAGKSADDFYRKLIVEQSISELHGFMRRRFATALQDDAQQAINAYLLASPAEMKRHWDGDARYADYPRYLRRAAELLGESHYMHDYLVAKALYFEGIHLRLLAEQKPGRDSLFFQAIEKQEAALKLEDRAAYFYNELGVLHTRLKMDEKAFEYYEKAMEMAPEWGLPYVNYCVGLFYTGQYEKALEYGEKALTLMPQHPQLYNFLAWIYANDYDWLDKQDWERRGVELSGYIWIGETNFYTLQQNRKRFERGVALLERAKMVDTLFANTFGNLGTMYWQLDEFEKAEQNLKTAIRIDSTKHIFFFFLGRLFFGQGRVDEGEQAMLKSIELTPDNYGKTIGYNSLAWGYGLKGEFKNRVESLKKAIELYPDFGYAHTNLASDLIQFGHYHQAERYLLEILIRQPAKHLLTYSKLGSLYRKMRRFEDAEILLKHSISLNPNFFEAQLELGQVFLAAGRIDEAKNTFQLVAERFGSADVYHSISLAYIDAGQFLEAEAACKKALELDSPYSLTNLGVCLYRQGKVEEAWQWWEKRQKMAPDKEAFYTAVVATGSMRTATEAFFKKGIELSKDKSVPLSYLAEWYEQNNRLTEAEASFQQAVSLKPDSEEGIARLAYFYLRTKQFDEAFKYFDKAYSLKPDKPQGSYDLACLHALKGNQEQAFAWLKEALEKGYPDLAHLLDDPDLISLRNGEGFYPLLHQFFPEEAATIAFLQAGADDVLYFPEHTVRLVEFYEQNNQPDRAKVLLQKTPERERK